MTPKSPFLHAEDIRSGRVRLDARGHVVVAAGRPGRRQTGTKGKAMLVREAVYATWRIEHVVSCWSFTVAGIRTVSETNQRGQWKTLERKKDQQERLFEYLCRHCARRPGVPVTVRVQRIAERRVDDHAEWHKWVVDELARWIGVDDASPLVKWEFDQRVTGRRGSWAVHVEVRFRTE